MEEQIEVAYVAAVVELRNEALVFLLCGLDLKTVDLPVVRRADELNPFATWSFACFLSLRNSRCKAQQMFAAVGIAQLRP